MLSIVVYKLQHFYCIFMSSDEVNMMLAVTHWFEVVLHLVLAEGLFWIQAEHNMWDTSSSNNYLFIRIYKITKIVRAL